MIRTVWENKSGFEWVDVFSPTNEDFSELSSKFGLPPTSIKNCLDPHQQPKYEKLGDLHFCVVRYLDPEARKRPDADTTRELTRKIALFMGREFLLTIHRSGVPFLSEVIEKRSRSGLKKPEHLVEILLDTIGNSISSYEPPLKEIEETVEDLEDKIFSRKGDPKIFERMYFLRRQVTVFRRTVHQSLDILFRMSADLPSRPPETEAVRENGERVCAYGDRLIEDINHLLSTQLSLASYHTNEIVRILTLFSVFFLPATFLVGVYGMNFDFMPELRWKYGYWSIWAVLAFSSTGIFLWFRGKGWLK